MRTFKKIFLGVSLEGTPETLIGYVIKDIQIEEEFGIVHYPIITETNKPEDIINGICIFHFGTRTSPNGYFTKDCIINVWKYIYNPTKKPGLILRQFKLVNYKLQGQKRPCKQNKKYIQ